MLPGAATTSTAKALRARLTSPAVVPYLPKLTRIMHNYVDTNLSPAEMLALVNFTGLEQENFKWCCWVVSVL